MKFAVLSALSLLASVVSAFHIVPPAGIASCDSLTVEYDTRSGQAPFNLAFHQDSADGAILAAFTDVTGTSYTWSQVSIPAGTNVVIVLSDGRGVGSATPPITVSSGSSDVCLDNPTSIPVIPAVTSTSPPTSTFSGPLPSVSPSLSTTLPLSSGLSSSLSSFTNSAGSQVVSGSTSSPSPTATGLGTNSGIVNTAGLFTIGVITVFFGALLA